MTMASAGRQQKKVYLVLGMSRTGTSAIARSLQALGIELGDQLIAGDARNPKGFYEDADVLYKINRGITHAIQHEWLWMDSLESRRLLNEPLMQPFKQVALRLIHQRLSSVDNWCFKDPRTDMLLPFWRMVLAEAGVDDHYIIAIRNPLSAAYSNQAFIGLDIEMGLLTWLKHMVAVIDGTAGKKRVVVAYETLMQSGAAQLERLHCQLGIKQPVSQQEIAQYTDDFLDADLNHHQYSMEECERHQAMRAMPLALRIYDLLLRAANDDIAINSEAFLDEWRQIKIDYVTLSPIYAYLDVLWRKNKNLQREIRNSHKAWSWKIMWPIRKLEQWVRARKRIAKERKRLCLMK